MSCFGFQVECVATGRGVAHILPLLCRGALLLLVTRALSFVAGVSPILRSSTTAAFEAATGAMSRDAGAVAIFLLMCPRVRLQSGGSRRDAALCRQHALLARLVAYWSGSGQRRQFRRLDAEAVALVVSHNAGRDLGSWFGGGGPRGERQTCDISFVCFVCISLMMLGCGATDEELHIFWLSSVVASDCGLS